MHNKFKLNLKDEQKQEKEVTKTNSKHDSIAKGKDDKLKLPEDFPNRKDQYLDYILVLKAPRFSKKHKASSICFKISIHPIFVSIIFLSIIVNTVALAWDSYNLDSNSKDILWRINLCLAAVFFFEFLIKIIGYGAKEYFKNKFHWVDFVLVIINGYEIYMMEVTETESGDTIAALGTLRTLRFLRIISILRGWKKLNELLLIIVKTFKDLQYFSILVILFVFITATLGKELFAYRVRFMPDGTIATNPLKGVSPRINFDTIQNSLLSVFIIITGENWQMIMFDHARCAGSFTAYFFFLTVIVTGNIILIRLFLAILIGNFLNTEMKKEIAVMD